jgi:hypothetical protein
MGHSAGKFLQGGTSRRTLRFDNQKLKVSILGRFMHEIEDRMNLSAYVL